MLLQIFALMFVGHSNSIRWTWGVWKRWWGHSRCFCFLFYFYIGNHLSKLELHKITPWIDNSLKFISQCGKMKLSTDGLGLSPFQPNPPDWRETRSFCLHYPSFRLFIGHHVNVWNGRPIHITFWVRLTSENGVYRIITVQMAISRWWWLMIISDKPLYNHQ